MTKNEKTLLSEFIESKIRTGKFYKNMEEYNMSLNSKTVSGYCRGRAEEIELFCKELKEIFNIE